MLACDRVFMQEWNVSVLAVGFCVYNIVVARLLSRHNSIIMMTCHSDTYTGILDL